MVPEFTRIMLPRDEYACQGRAHAQPSDRPSCARNNFYRWGLSFLHLHLFLIFDNCLSLIVCQTLRDRLLKKNYLGNFVLCYLSRSVLHTTGMSISPLGKIFDQPFIVSFALFTSTLQVDNTKLSLTESSPALQAGLSLLLEADRT